MVDFEKAKEIFTLLYQNIDGHKISTTARKKMPTYDRTLTYGEVTPETFYTILNSAKPKSNDIFYDLGCGTGKAVFLASFFNDFKKTIGIELLKELYDTSEKVLDLWNNEVKKKAGLEEAAAEIKFVNADFLTFDFSDGDMIFAHSTCFSEGVMKVLESKFTGLKKGTKIITVTKWLQSPGFHLIERKEYPFTWGTGTVSIYERM